MYVFLSFIFSLFAVLKSKCVIDVHDMNFCGAFELVLRGHNESECCSYNPVYFVAWSTLLLVLLLYSVVEFKKHPRENHCF